MSDYFVQDCCQEQNNGHCIEHMHHPQIESGGPAGVLFPEKIHNVNVRSLHVKSKK